MEKSHFAQARQRGFTRPEYGVGGRGSRLHLGGQVWKTRFHRVYGSLMSCAFGKVRTIVHRGQVCLTTRNALPEDVASSKS